MVEAVKPSSSAVTTIPLLLPSVKSQVDGAPVVNTPAANATPAHLVLKFAKVVAQPGETARQFAQRLAPDNPKLALGFLVAEGQLVFQRAQIEKYESTSFFAQRDRQAKWNVQPGRSYSLMTESSQTIACELAEQYLRAGEAAWGAEDRAAHAALWRAQPESAPRLPEFTDPVGALVPVAFKVQLSSPANERLGVYSPGEIGKRSANTVYEVAQAIAPGHTPHEVLGQWIATGEVVLSEQNEYRFARPGDVYYRYDLPGSARELTYRRMGISALADDREWARGDVNSRPVYRGVDGLEPLTEAPTTAAVSTPTTSPVAVTSPRALPFLFDNAVTRGINRATDGIERAVVDLVVTPVVSAFSLNAGNRLREYVNADPLEMQRRGETLKPLVTWNGVKESLHTLGETWGEFNRQLTDEWRNTNEGTFLFDTVVGAGKGTINSLPQVAALFVRWGGHVDAAVVRRFPGGEAPARWIDETIDRLRYEHGKDPNDLLNVLEPVNATETFGSAVGPFVLPMLGKAAQVSRARGLIRPGAAMSAVHQADREALDFALKSFHAGKATVADVNEAMGKTFEALESLGTGWKNRISREEWQRFKRQRTEAYDLAQTPRAHPR